MKKLLFILTVSFAILLTSCSPEGMLARRKAREAKARAELLPTTPQQSTYQNGSVPFLLSDMNDLLLAGKSEDSLKKIKFSLSGPVNLKGAKAVSINEKGEVIWSRADQISSALTGYINTINTDNGTTNFAVAFIIKQATYLIWFNATASPSQPGEFSFSLDEATPGSVFFNNAYSPIYAHSDSRIELKYVVKKVN